MKKIVLCILVLLIFTMIVGYYRQQRKNVVETEECKMEQLVAQDLFWIRCYEYNLKDLTNLRADIIRKGKIIKTFNKENKDDKYFLFEYNDLMISDTIKVSIKKDVYYIHSFENDYWLGYKPHKCFLNIYKINKHQYEEKRGDSYGEEYSDSSPSKKEFYLSKKDLK